MAITQKLVECIGSFLGRIEARTPLDPIDLTSAEFQADPHGSFARLRKEDPVHKSSSGAWIVTRYDDVQFVLRDSRFGHPDYLTAWAAQANPTPLDTFRSHNIVSRNPPDHTRMRDVVQKAFTPKKLEAIRLRIQAIADELIDKVEAKGRMEIVHEYAYALPLAVISEILGLPADDAGTIEPRMFEIMAVFELVATDEALANGNKACEWFFEYTQSMMEKVRKDGTPGLILEISNAVYEENRLSEAEARSLILFLLTAGHSTTMKLISNGIHLLLEYPEQAAKLRRDPDLIKTAVEEILRFESPVQLFGRCAFEEVQLGKHVIREGETVYAVVASANRDDQRFTDPNVFDITRNECRHLAFGDGIHACLGALLGRMDGEIAIETLLRRMPDMKLSAGGCEWEQGLSIRQLNKLEVTF